MSNVIIDKSKIDILANAISCKSGEPVTMTLAEMVSAVDGIETGGGTPTLETITKTYTPSTSAVTDTITPSSGYDGIEEVDVTVSAVPVWDGILDSDNEYLTSSGSRKWRYRPKMFTDSGEDGYVESGTKTGSYSTYDAIASGTSITPTESAQTIGGSNYMMEGAVTVNAIPSNYVGSGITQRTSSDLSASTLTVTAPSGYYSSNASKTLTDANLVASNIKKDVQIFGVTGSYEGGGTSSKNVQVVQGTTRTNASTLTAVGSALTVSKTGTYDVYYSGMRTNTSSSYTWATQLYVGGSAYGSENTTWSNNVQNVHLTNVSLTANQTVRVYGRNTRGTSYYIYAPTLVIVEA